MNPRKLLASSALVLAPFVSSVHADIVLSANLSFVEQGGTIDAGNLAPAGTAFAKDLLNGDGFGVHTIASMNNGTFGNSSSWIGNSDPSYAGIGFASSQSIASFAFGRDNTSAFQDRSAGTYLVEFTTSADPAVNHTTATWNSIGSMTITTGGPTSSWLRHRFNITTPVNATGFRIVTPGGAAIDEIEIYNTPGIFVPPPPAIVTTPAAGYSIAWDGNDGDNFSAVGLVPNNLALASNGSTPIASGALGPEIGSVTTHVIPNINDGRYGNGFSWIGGSADAGPLHAGVMLNGLYDVTAIAWGRDNGLDSANGECCLGQLTDRSLGTYTVQRTLDGSLWENIGTVQYLRSDDAALGGDFTSYFRHEFELSDGDGGILARGLRLLVPSTGLAGGTAIDEIEIYGTLVPEPAGAGLLALAGAMLMRRRRA